MRSPETLGADHPRVRGEHVACVYGSRSISGSSPRTRGTHLAVSIEDAGIRIIPAYAGNTSITGLRQVPWTDHPRVRGEHSASASSSITSSGSSPRTRGTHERHVQPGRFLRIIPAYAGNTSSWPSTRNGRPDHPRVRGEHLRPNGPSPTSTGSSPRTRGTPRHADHRPARQRIIPAYAGNTRHAPPHRVCGADHPRVRGEHLPPPMISVEACGSSPRTRGTRQVRAELSRKYRIIPAYAGNTTPKNTPLPAPPDHPRVRGEHITGTAMLLPSAGSSPRTRGTLLRHLFPFGHLRIIPAYAGNTVRYSAQWASSSDHPRVRGEHAFFAASSAWTSGSSPRTRGTHRRRSPRGTPRRIIPAYAGNTAPTSDEHTRRADHPRVRGEHTRSSTMPGGPSGSSPRTRGTRWPTKQRALVPRIIPAYAGNTRSSPRVRPGPADHPRVRGEHVVAAHARGAADGSSPRTRGTPEQRACDRPARRIIPAYAGNTCGWRYRR